MFRKNFKATIFEPAFSNCYLSDDRPRNVKKPVQSRSIPYLSFDDDLYQEHGAPRGTKIPSKFKAVRPICDYLEDGPTSLEFWKFFKMLPADLRNKIYKLLIFAWSPDAQWARLSRNGRRFGVSRRNRTHRPLSTCHYVSDDPLGLEKEDLVDWTRDKDWEQSEGMLDFFKLNEYRNIQRLVWFVERVEYALQLDERKSKNETGENKGKSKEIQKAANDEYINLWKEVVDFFWDNVTVDFGERLHYGTIVLKESNRQKNVQHQQCTTKDNHAEVRHICLRLDTVWHSEDHTTHEPLSDHCELCRFLLLCEFITEHFQSVKTLLLYLSLSMNAVYCFGENKNEFAKDVVDAIRALKVSEVFDLRLQIVTQENRRIGDVITVAERDLDAWVKSWRQWFLNHLEPYMVRENQKTEPNSPIEDTDEEASESDLVFRAKR
ncbi:8ead57e9-b7f3-4813-888d-5dcb1b2ddd77 [Sclerotinia trifoliorum]|uniref:8ead57e9-b7f3-4813-888d-5dcb1b2ddd77 n=1 Tax=Sclerotinia trifoliorum TaxID=28548 RepID=A0A8H2VPN6_9HELO|nr:8ead57e9-b7f3-4813-888d-5dcb1b2ddd77 [Sclerotinia trifoliorum]